LRDHVRNTAGNEAQAIPRGQELSPTERVLPSEAHTEVRYVFRRDGDFWTVQFGQEKLPALRHLDGMVYIAHALKNRDGPWSAWQLYQMFKARASEGVSMDEWTMDATDPKAIKACRERLKNIEKELGDARENKQTTRIEKLEQERKKIEKYLSQNQDKWGRPRKLGHKSRTKVRNAIVRARENIKKHSKALWVHLVNDLDTGNQIRYRGHFKWEI